LSPENQVNKTLCQEIKENLGHLLNIWHSETIRMGKEIGGVICKRNTSMDVSSVCEGEKCQVLITHTCPKSSIYFADLHTHLGHPERPPGLSIPDVVSAANAGVETSCVIDRGILECASNIFPTINISADEHNKSAIKILEEVQIGHISSREAEEQYKKLIQRLGVRLCHLKI